MLKLRMNTRCRIFGACLAIALLATGVMVMFGIGLRHALRGRAQDSSVLVAQMFSNHVRQFLLAMTGQANALADHIASFGDASPPERLNGVPMTSGMSLELSWAVYDPNGQRVVGRTAKQHGAEAQAAGIGAESILPREKGRLTEALAGNPSTVLFPVANETYALIYRPVHRPGKEPWALQVAARIDKFSLAENSVEGAKVFVWPFYSSSERPRFMHVANKLCLVVHRPVVLGGRQLGTVVSAIPYEKEARFERTVAILIAIFAIGLMAASVAIGHRLTNVAMVPLNRLNEFMENLRQGGEVEQPEDMPDGVEANMFTAYQQMLGQSQEWADRIMEAIRDLRSLLIGAIKGLVTAVEAKDHYTAGHSKRVSYMACLIADELGWSPAAIENLRLGALLHDAGKIGITEGILNKPGSLTEDELAVIREHPGIGAQIVDSLPNCEDIVRMVRHHHERCDGGGYPDGISGDDISPAARIIAIADAFDALTSERSYRSAKSYQEALTILSKDRGTMFDPDIFDAFMIVFHNTLSKDQMPDDLTDKEGGTSSAQAARPFVAATGGTE